MDTVLEILISAVDNASETLAEVSDSLNAMAAETTDAAEEASASFDAMTTSIDESFNEVLMTVNSATGEIQSALLTQDQSFQLAAAVAQESDQEIIDQMLMTASTAEEAAADIAEANALIASSAEEAETSSAGAYAGLAAVAGIAFLAIKGAVGDAVTSAQVWDEESANIVQTLKNTGSAIPLSAIQAYAQQIQTVTLLTQQQALQAEGLILNYKNLQPSYQSLTMLTADLATKMSQTSGTMSDNMPNAAKILSNALIDPVAGINQLIRQGTVSFPAATVTMIENMAKVGDTAGADAIILKTLNNSIGGMAQAAADAEGGPLTQLENKLIATGTVIGNDLLPLLDTMAKDLEPIIADVTAWAAEHPRLTDAIVLGAVALTALLLVIGLLGVAIITVTPVIELVGVVIAGLTSPIGILVIAVVAAVALIVTNWKTLQADTEAIWTDIANFFASIWQTIISGLKSDINNVISLINGLITAIDAIHINIPAIQIPGTKIGTPPVDINFDIPQIPHLAAGGIVSVPTVALIGENGPEAIVPLSSSGIGAFAGTGGTPGGQQIIVNINGGSYLDSQGAKMIGDELAKQILRGLKVKNFAL
jgi:hypothetical protein